MLLDVSARSLFVAFEYHYAAFDINNNYVEWGFLGFGGPLLRGSIRRKNIHRQLRLCHKAFRGFQAKGEGRECRDPILDFRSIRRRAAVYRSDRKRNKFHRCPL